VQRIAFVSKQRTEEKLKTATRMSQPLVLAYLSGKSLDVSRRR
jgi:hypothetical protein